jgi:hypothetical protein
MKSIAARFQACPGSEREKREREAPSFQHIGVSEAAKFTLFCKLM